MSKNTQNFKRVKNTIRFYEENRKKKKNNLCLVMSVKLQSKQCSDYVIIVKFEIEPVGGK